MDQQDDITLPPPVGWIEALERCRADREAGRIVPGETIMAELDACIERMDARRLAKATDAA